MSYRCNNCLSKAGYRCSGSGEYYCSKQCQQMMYQKNQSIASGLDLMLVQGKRGRDERSMAVATAMAKIIDQEDLSIAIANDYFYGEKDKLYALLTLEDENLPFFVHYNAFQKNMLDFFFKKSVVRSDYDKSLGQMSPDTREFSRTIDYYPGKEESENAWDYMKRQKNILLN